MHMDVPASLITSTRVSLDLIWFIQFNSFSITLGLQHFEAIRYLYRAFSTFIVVMSLGSFIIIVPYTILIEVLRRRSPD